MIHYEYAVGATPLDPDESVGLIPSHISNQSELNTWEEANIAQAEIWLDKKLKRLTSSMILTEDFVRALHLQMFNRTWRWSGKFRKSNKNIGVDWTYISVKLDDLLKNIQYQMRRQIYSIDELAIRFHHQLVWIHPFPNGNGRHARMMADSLLKSQGCDRFSWGGDYSLSTMNTLRKEYIDSLRKADNADYSELIKFART